MSKWVVRPAMLFDLETETLRTRQEAELENMEMLRFYLGITRMIGDRRSSLSEGYIPKILEVNSERPDRDGLNMSRGGQ